MTAGMRQGEATLIVRRRGAAGQCMRKIEAVEAKVAVKMVHTENQSAGKNRGRIKINWEHTEVVDGPPCVDFLSDRGRAAHPPCRTARIRPSAAAGGRGGRRAPA